jgi:hypothetical protein
MVGIFPCIPPPFCRFLSESLTHIFTKFAFLTHIFAEVADLCVKWQYLLESFGTITKFSPLDLDAQWSKGKKRHARFMPRWASRLTLEVTDVRLQKLQEITEEDPLAEGCPGYAWHRHPALGICADEGALPSEEFQSLWESIHGPEAWEENPALQEQTPENLR